MKSKIIAFITLISLLFSETALAATVKGLRGGFSTQKTIVLVGVIDEAMTNSVYVQMKLTENLPGPRLVIIKSPGGMVSEGKKIIQMLEQERARTNQKLVCAVMGAAHSMAFNLLTHCDVRLATPDSRMVAHKVALGGMPGERMSAKNMRKMADDMDKIDKQLNEDNRKAMHLSAEEYDTYADAEREWKAQELLEMHYLDDIVRITP